MQPSGAVPDALWLGCQVSASGWAVPSGWALQLWRAAAAAESDLGYNWSKGQATEVSEVAAEGRVWLRLPKELFRPIPNLYLGSETKY